MTAGSSFAAAAIAVTFVQATTAIDLRRTVVVPLPSWPLPL